MQVAPFKRFADVDRRSRCLVIHNDPLPLTIIQAIYDTAKFGVPTRTFDHQRFRVVVTELAFAINWARRLLVIPGRLSPQQTPDAPLDLRFIEFPEPVAAHFASVKHALKNIFGDLCGFVYRLLGVV